MLKHSFDQIGSLKNKQNDEANWLGLIKNLKNELSDNSTVLPQWFPVFLHFHADGSLSNGIFPPLFPVAVSLK